MKFLIHNSRRFKTAKALWSLVAVLALGLTATAQKTPSKQQQQEDKSTPGLVSYTDAKDDADAVTHMGASASPTSAVAIDGSGILPMQDDNDTTLAIATGLLGGYDSALLGKGGLSSGLAGGEMDIAALIKRKRGAFMLQNATTTTTMFRDDLKVVALNRTSLDMIREINQRWSWNARGASSYGNDMVRAITSADSRSLGGISLPTSEAAAYSLRTGNVLSTEGSVSLQYRQSRVSEWRFSASDTYEKYYDLGGSVNTIRGRADFVRTLTRNYSHGFFAAAGRQSGTVECIVGGGGYQALYHPGRRLTIDANAGPLVGTEECGRTLQFLAGLNLYYEATPNTSLYLSADRELNDGVVQKAIWLNTAIVGMRHAFSQRIDSRVDFGGFQGKNQNTTNDSSYYNMYVSAAVRHMVSSHIDEELSFRRYFSSGFSATPDRTFVLFTLWITPGRRSQSGR